jgi:hypothetical protein
MENLGLLPTDHELRINIATWYRAMAGDSSIVAPLLDEFVNPKGDAVTLAEKFERAERRKLERARVQGVKKGLREAQRKGVCNTLVALMRKRFGKVPQDVLQPCSTSSRRSNPPDSIDTMACSRTVGLA